MTAYLDNAATTRVRSEVLEAMVPHLRGTYGNPSSIHAAGRQARRVVEDARELIADRLRVQPLQIIFTSCATEANNLALFGSGAKRLAVSAIEHESVLKPAQRLEAEILPVDGGGRVQWRETAAELVSIMMVNNEVGTIQPVAELAERVHAIGAQLHVDAVQALGKVAVDLPASGADLVSISSHKIHGPKGAGALVALRPERLTPVMFGGSQAFEKRAGTENVAAIAGFAKAVELAVRDLAQMSRVEKLRDRLESGLLSKIAGARVNGDPRRRAPHISNLQFPGIDGEALLMALDGRGVWVSSGSACAALGTEPSHVLVAMGLPPEAVKGSIRFSLALDTTDAEIDEALAVVPEVVNALRGR
jgi:cysteine desulfurase